MATPKGSASPNLYSPHEIRVRDKSLWVFLYLDIFGPLVVGEGVYPIVSILYIDEAVWAVEELCKL